MAKDDPNANLGETPAKSRTAQRVLLTVVALVVIAAIGWGIEWFAHGRFLESTNDAYLQADTVTVAPDVTGYVETVFVADNQTVQVGQPLVKVDERLYRAALNQVIATMTARKADVDRAKAEAEQQEATIAQASAQRAAARVATVFAAKQVARYAPLAASGADTAERLDQLSDTRDQAQATEKASAAALEAAQRQRATLNAAVEQAEAQLAAAQASVHQAEIDLNHTLIRSSIAGRIGDRTVRVGQYVQPGARLMSVVPVQDLYLTANFKENQIGHMRIGQSATIAVDALPGAHVQGRVQSFAPGTGGLFALLPPENATGNFTKIVQRVPVRISVEASAAARQILVPGLSVTVTIDTRAGEDIRD